ncbi:MAG: cbb3-type cytochrome c oxidase subunit I [Planctomycetales bacterium]|nr:cbb3-type cytochrome c oxidase subunit I [Planctomycetales bacterium]
MTPAGEAPPIPLPAAAARRARAWLLLAFASCTIALAAGLLGTLAYVPALSGLRPLGLTFERLRPIHTTFAVAWIFLAAVAVLEAYAGSLHRDGPDGTRHPRWGARLQAGLWIAAGVGALGTLSAGIFSGREYLEFHPLLSVPILAGWLVLVWRWARATGFRFRDRPVYVWMWNVALLLFVVTFCEGHLWLLRPLGWNPVRDIAIQWKSYGALIGSFNLLVYGTALWLGERLSGDPRPARSNAAFALFFVGLLNSLTNFGHHTYHLPQSPWAKWVSFVVSMAEILILLRVLLDVARLPRSWNAVPGALAANALLAAGTLWTALQLVLALALSVPPVNAHLHGTHVVAAHAMGSMIGIDSMILLAAAAALLPACGAPARAALRSPLVLAAIAWLNLSLLAFWGGLLATGIAAAIRRALGPSAPALYPERFPIVFSVAGAAVALGFLVLLALWTRAALVARESASLGPGVRNAREDVLSART